MPRRRRLAIEPMTPGSFAPFGRLLEPSGEPPDRRVTTRLPFECDGRTTMPAIRQPCAGRSFSRLGRHFGVTRTFAQVSGSPSVVRAAPPADLVDPAAAPHPGDVRAFLIDPGRPSRSPAVRGIPSIAAYSPRPERRSSSSMSIRTRPGSSTTRTGPRAATRTSAPILRPPSRPSSAPIRPRRVRRRRRVAPRLRAPTPGFRSAPSLRSDAPPRALFVTSRYRGCREGVGIFFTPTEMALFRGLESVRGAFRRISPHGAACAGAPFPGRRAQERSREACLAKTSQRTCLDAPLRFPSRGAPPMIPLRPSIDPTGRPRHAP